MYVSMSELSLVLLYSLFLGLFLGCAYDVIRLSRIAVGVRYKNVSETPFDFSSLRIVGRYIKKGDAKEKRGNFLSVFICIGDILFFVFAAICISVFTYHFNSGEFRFFILFGAVLGFLLYYLTLGRVVLYLSSKIILFIKILLLYTSFFVFYPFSFVFLKIYRVFYIIIGKTILIIKKTCAIMYMYHYSYKMEKKAFRDSKRGFLCEYKNFQEGKNA
ncbi:MAG: spore cortex biosynthesis protein YabQ [Clostridia bacterium]|nr:spore cortex biosynthesis protein YabQ [Clostridia bacterium]